MTEMSDIAVREFRQILIWPLQLMPLQAGCGLLNHWDYLDRDPNRTWVELDDEFPEHPENFQERHYREFAAFLPHVQRFLYGERASRTGRTTYGESPIRIFRRHDAEVLAILGHDPDLGHANAVVDTDLRTSRLAAESSPHCHVLVLLCPSPAEPVHPSFTCRRGGLASASSRA